MKPTETQINELLNECTDYEEEGTSKYPGMTYEQGIKAAIEWLLYDGIHPLDD